MMHELPASAEQHQLATIGNDTPGPIGGQVADLVSTGYSLTPFNFLISSYFLFFYIFSLLIIFILVSSSLFSLFLCRSVFFFVSCLSMNHLHSPGTFPTLFLETMPGSRHSYFHFLFSWARHFSLTALTTLTLTLTQLTFTQRISLLLNKTIYVFSPHQSLLPLYPVLVDTRSAGLLDIGTHCNKICPNACSTIICWKDKYLLNDFWAFVGAFLGEARYSPITPKLV